MHGGEWKQKNNLYSLLAPKSRKEFVFHARQILKVILKVSSMAFIITAEIIVSVSITKYE